MASDKTVRMWPVRSVKLHESHILRTGQTGPVMAVAFSPDGRTLATGNVGGTVRLWDVRTAASRRILRYGANVWSVSFTPDGRSLIARYDDGELRQWNTTTGKSHAITTQHTKPV